MPGVGCVYAQAPSQVGDVATSIDRGEFKIANDQDRIELVERLYTTSFPGKISDPMHTPGVMDSTNMRLVALNLFEVAKTCK